MNRKEFFELGTDVFAEYSPKVKAKDRKEFMYALFDELVAHEILEEEVEDEDPEEKNILEEDEDYFGAD